MTAGYRNYDLSDDLTIQENLVTLISQVQTGTQINIVDSFRTRNFFNGAELGLVGNYYSGRWSLPMLGPACHGRRTPRSYTSTARRTSYRPAGQSYLTVAACWPCKPTSATTPATSSSSFPSWAWKSAISSPNACAASWATTFLYWGQVVRAGDQINLNIDTRNIPPVQQGAGPQPSFAFNTTSFWAQGIRLGAELRF